MTLNVDLIVGLNFPIKRNRPEIGIKNKTQLVGAYMKHSSLVKTNIGLK
jgi:hypothetical protein